MKGQRVYKDLTESLAGSAPRDVRGRKSLAKAGILPHRPSREKSQPTDHGSAREFPAIAVTAADLATRIGPAIRRNLSNGGKDNTHAGHTIEHPHQPRACQLTDIASKVSVRFLALASLAGRPSAPDSY
jgi:hypothetical protein